MEQIKTRVTWAGCARAMSARQALRGAIYDMLTRPGQGRVFSQRQVMRIDVVTPPAMGAVQDPWERFGPGQPEATDFDVYITNLKRT